MQKKLFPRFHDSPGRFAAVGQVGKYGQGNWTRKAEKRLELLEVVANIVDDNGDSNFGDRSFPPRLSFRGCALLGLLGNRLTGLYRFRKLRPPVRRQKNYDRNQTRGNNREEQDRPP
jgi:hypothetical protein